MQYWVMLISNLIAMAELHSPYTGEDLRDDADPQTRGWFAQSLTSSGSSLALAFLCTKALLPVRVPLTLAITPPIAR